MFTTLSANEYDALLINDAWLSTYVPENTGSIWAYQSNVSLRIWDAYQAGEMERLEPRECIDTYAQPFLSSNSHVVLVSKSNNGSIDDGPQIFDTSGGGGIHITGSMDGVNLDAYPWICGGRGRRPDDYFCDVDALGLQDGDFEWNLSNRTVRYCLSEVAEETLQTASEHHNRGACLHSQPAQIRIDHVRCVRHQG